MEIVHPNCEHEGYRVDQFAVTGLQFRQRLWDLIDIKRGHARGMGVEQGSRSGKGMPSLTLAAWLAGSNSQD